MHVLHQEYINHTAHTAFHTMPFQLRSPHTDATPIIAVGRDANRRFTLSLILVRIIKFEEEVMKLTA